MFICSSDKILFDWQILESMHLKPADTIGQGYSFYLAFIQVTMLTHGYVYVFVNLNVIFNLFFYVTRHLQSTSFCIVC